MSHPIKDILVDAGYKLTDCNDFWRTAARYRNGKNPNCLAINKFSGWFRDFKTGQAGPPEDLAKLVKGETVSFENYTPVETEEKIQVPKIYPKEILKRLLPQYDFFLKRGISKETLVLFEAGMAHSGKMNKRICFPIYDRHNRIIGFSGRWHSEKIPEGGKKWKHLSPSSSFLFPVHLNDKILREQREAILTESIGDILALWEAGIHTGLCMFGISLSSKLISYIMGIDPHRIIIATNRDGSSNDEAGQRAAVKIKTKLKKFFDKSKIIIAPPPEPFKDFGEILDKGIIQDYYKNIS